MTTRLARTSLTLAAFLLGGSLPALAATIVATPPQYQVSPNPNQCFVANPGEKDIVVPRLELVSLSGTVITSLAPNTLLAAGTVRSIQASGGGLTYCRAVGVSAKKIRLTHCVRTSTGAPCSAVTVGQ